MMCGPVCEFTSNNGCQDVMIACCPSGGPEDPCPDGFEGNPILLCCDHQGGTINCFGADWDWVCMHLANRLCDPPEGVPHCTCGFFSVHMDWDVPAGCEAIGTWPEAGCVPFDAPEMATDLPPKLPEVTDAG
jgi:hypothetical protein